MFFNGLKQGGTARSLALVYLVVGRLGRGFFVDQKGKMIRKAEIKDLKIIYSLLQEGVNSGKVLTRSKQEIKAHLDSFLVYVLKDQVIGCCSLEVYSSKLAEIRSLVVKVEFRNKGIGRKLIERCLKEAREKDIYQVLSVTSAKSLFVKIGFKNELDDKRPMFINLKRL